MKRMRAVAIQIDAEAMRRAGGPAPKRGTRR
jgi:hypothetical protein